MCRLPGFEASIGGIFTFGAPRVGDAESARISSALYHGRCFRYMHASDMVCGCLHSFSRNTISHAQHL